MVRNLIFILIIVPLFISCNRGKYDSAGKPPKGTSIIVGNPLSSTTKMNNKEFVRVNVNVIVTALDAYNQMTVNYSQKSQQFSPSSGFGTPGNLVIEGVETPSGGPFEVKVFVRALDCNPFAPNCSANIGGMQEYFASYSFSSTGSPPSAINFGGLSMLNSICCN